MMSMLADTNVVGVLLLALGILAVLASSVALYLRGRAKGKELEIPVTMRPGPSDGALETPLLQKLQGWSVVLIAFFVVWFPLVWLFEPKENEKQEVELQTLAEERGAEAVLPFTEENQLGVGCVRCHGPDLKGGIIIDKGQPAYPKNLTTICYGNADPEHAAIATVDDIYQVIEQGRGAMPSWSVKYQGALTDQQINDIVVYLIHLSSETVPFEDNICLNPDAADAAVKRAEQAGTDLALP
jgi:mono/diheme cytochrome c family protein